MVVLKTLKTLNSVVNPKNGKDPIRPTKKWLKPRIRDLKPRIRDLKSRIRDLIDRNFEKKNENFFEKLFCKKIVNFFFEKKLL